MSRALRSIVTLVGIAVSCCGQSAGPAGPAPANAAETEASGGAGGAGGAPSGRARAPSAELLVTVTAPREVGFGASFELVVERSWPRAHAPQPFDPLRLLPLATTELAATVTPKGDRLVERRRYSAAMWRVGDFELGPFELETKDAAGQVHANDSGPVPLVVASVLPEPAGPIEWSGDVWDRPRAAVWPYGLAAAVLLGGVGLGWRQWRRARPTPEPQPAPAPSPATLAAAELDALTVPDTEAEPAVVEAFYIALAEVVRRFATRAFGIAAVVHTSPELVAVVPRGGDPLRDCLFACDLVKFAADHPAVAAHLAARDRALAFIEAGQLPQPEGVTG